MAGDTITDVAVFAVADVAAGDLVFASGICVTVVGSGVFTLVPVNALLGAPLVPGVSVLAVTFAINAD